MLVLFKFSASENLKTSILKLKEIAMFRSPSSAHH
jgi:hypothetical protein